MPDPHTEKATIDGPLVSQYVAAPYALLTVGPHGGLLADMDVHGF